MRVPNLSPADWLIITVCANQLVRSSGPSTESTKSFCALICRSQLIGGVSSAGADGRVLEHQLAVGRGMQARAGADVAVLELEPAAAFLVARHDLRGEIALLQPLAERLVPPALELEHHRQAEQDERELGGLERHGVLPVGLRSGA